MTAEQMLRLTEGLVLTLFVGIRGYYILKTGTSGDSPTEEGPFILSWRRILGTAFIAALVLHLMKPGWIQWSALNLPIWLRWLGAPLSALGLLFLIWVHRTLGENFSLTLTIRDKHALITHGPYRWVRHPMYLSFLVLVLGCFLLLGGWFLGLCGLLGIGVVMLLRAPKEEELLARTFGDEYAAYSNRTGRFLPSVSWTGGQPDLKGD